MRARAAAPLILVLAACASAGETGRGPDLGLGEGWRVAPSRAGMFLAAWRPVPDPIPNNEPFELEVRVYDAAGTPLEGVEVFVNAWMPEHRHGMPRRPQAFANADGSYRVRGMLFHMGGYWQLFVDVVRDGISERAEFDVTIE